MGLVALALFVVPAVAPAQTNRVEKTIPYRLDVSTKVDAKVGPVMIDNVKITNMGRGFGRGGFGPKGMQPSEGSTTLRFAFDVNNPGEDWEITFTLEFYDKAGKLIDRVTKKQNWEEKAEVWHFDHPILEYVLPMVSDVKISMSRPPRLTGSRSCEPSCRASSSPSCSACWRARPARSRSSPPRSRPRSSPPAGPA